MPSMATGTITNWNTNRGHGIISASDGRDFFLHHSQWREDFEPAKGDSVEFTEAVGKDRKPYARDVRKINDAEL